MFYHSTLSDNWLITEDHKTVENMGLYPFIDYNIMGGDFRTALSRSRGTKIVAVAIISVIALGGITGYTKND